MSEKKEKATGSKEEKRLSAEEIKTARENQRKECQRKIAEVLKEYGCELTARMIVGEQGNLPQVFIIDARD